MHRLRCRGEPPNEPIRREWPPGRKIVLNRTRKGCIQFMDLSPFTAETGELCPAAKKIKPNIEGYRYIPEGYTRMYIYRRKNDGRKSKVQGRKSKEKKMNNKSNKTINIIDNQLLTNTLHKMKQPGNPETSICRGSLTAFEMTGAM